jgi:hypothetical protein
MSHGGKGDTPRPYSVDQETFKSNWDLIFNKGKKFPVDEKEILKNQEDNKNSTLQDDK